MITNKMKDLHEEAGLVPTGKNFFGEQEYIGTRQQWDAYENLEMGDALAREVLPKDTEALNPNNQNLEDNECDEKITAWI